MELDTDPAKKDIIFCDGEVFPLDRSLLMGAKNAGLRISIFITYIVFLTKMQKGKPTKMDLPLLKNDITNVFDL